MSETKPLTDEELDALESNALRIGPIAFVGMLHGIALRLVAQARDANRLREDNATLRADMECAVTFRYLEGRVWVGTSDGLWHVHQFNANNRLEQTTIVHTREEALALARAWAGKDGEK